MDYVKIYWHLISKRVETPSSLPYVERHHITPKCLGGSDAPDNLVILSAREHFICHALLAEMFVVGSFEWYKMNHAFMMMKASCRRGRYMNSRLYEAKRRDFSKTMSWSQQGSKNSSYDTAWIFHEGIEKTIKVPLGAVEVYLTKGWKKGRVFDFAHYREVQRQLKNQHGSNYLDDTSEKEKRRVDRKVRREAKTLPTFPKTGYRLNRRRRRDCAKFFSLDIYDPEEATALYCKLHREYVNLDLSTTRLAKKYNTTDPTIRKLLIDIGIGTKKRNGKWD